jgi:hypothetical protein
VRAIAQDVTDPCAVWVANEEPARPSVDLAEPLTGEPHSGGVHDREQLIDVIEEQPVEDCLVGVLERAQV